MSNSKNSTDQMKTNVKNHFHRLRQALDLREKLLLRQIDVLLSQYKNRQLNQKIEIDSVDFLPINEDELLAMIRSYGKFNVENFKISDLYENEDYIAPDNDHELFYKSFQNEEEYVPDNKSMTHSLKDKCNILNESIINMTLTESKELIEKSVDLVSSVSDKLKKDMKIAENQNKKKKSIDSNPSNRQGNKETTEKTVKSNENKQVAKASTKSEEKKSKLKRNEPTTSSTKKTLKNISNLTLNNCCNGIINLKNISHLTINTCKGGKSPTAEKLQVKQETEEEIVSPECGFYQRLITENKILKSHIIKQNFLPGVTCPGPHIIKKEPIAAEKGGEIDEGTYSLHSVSAETSGMSSITDAEDGFQMNVKELPEQTNKSPNQSYYNMRSPLPNSNLVFPFPNSPVSVTEAPIVEPTDDIERSHPIVKITLPESKEEYQKDEKCFEEISNSKYFQSSFMPGSSHQGFGICFMEFDPQPMTHPVQVQHWLKQIILETETEPNQTAEFVEISDLN